MVPASGAASRMFFEMNKALREYKVTRSELEKRAQEGKEDAKKLLEFFFQIRRIGFRLELERVLQSTGLDLKPLLDEGNYHEILKTILHEEGMNYSGMPKGLIPFHLYRNGSRTPVAEHLAEAAHLVRDSNGTCRVHFTLSPEHEAAFRTHVSLLQMDFEQKGDCRFEMKFSYQKPSTDTLSLDEDRKPLRDEQGCLLFRPGGHGALIENLAEFRCAFLFIKNIDNVACESKNGEAIRWEKVLGGILIQRKEQANQWLRELRKPGFTPSRAEEILEEITNQWLQEVPPAKDLKARLQTFLDRPMRVCGVVPNTGEPGGGPFWVKSKEGFSTLQIVESSQVDLGNPTQADIFRSSTHFNPVDMVCSLQDYSQKPYDLNRFVDPQTVFLSQKSYRGLKIRALERPGLWNGAMAGWLTFFVEMPLATFHPVKTVFDLLKPSHQPGG